MDPQYIALAILAGVVLLLVTEWVSMGIVGFGAVVALVVFGVIESDTAFAMLGAPIILLVTCAFVFGEAFFKVGLADLIGSWVERIAQKYGHGSEKFVIALAMIILAAMSTVLPNLGVAAALLPVLMVIARTTGIATARVLIPAAFASSLGGMITLIGSPNNLIGRGALESGGAGTMGFFDIAVVGLPFAIVGVLYLVFIGTRWLPGGSAAIEYTKDGDSGEIGRFNGVDTDQNMGGGGNTTLVRATEKVQVAKWKRNLTLVMFGVFVLGIALEPVIMVPSFIVGLLALGVLLVSGVLSEHDAYKSISWSTLFFIVGILTLADAIVATGASDLLANGLLILLGGNPSEVVLVGALFLFTALLTQFMSNTATAGIFAPVAVSIGLGMGGDPKALVLAVVLGASCAFVTPIGTPANMMMVGPGNIKFLDWVKVGWPLILIGVVLSVVILPLVWPVIS